MSLSAAQASITRRSTSRSRMASGTTRRTSAPSAGLEALIESARDCYLDELPAGTCAACSYAKSLDVADLEGRDEAIDRAVNDPER
jgi:hypothetical protein